MEALKQLLSGGKWKEHSPDLDAAPAALLELPAPTPDTLSAANLALLRGSLLDHSSIAIAPMTVLPLPSLYSAIPRAEKLAVLSAILASPSDPRNRAVGALLGMAIADAVGHPFEFMAVCDVVGASGSRYDARTLRYTRALNSFRLLPGQWTDDASMGFCIADSLIARRGAYHGGDVRVRFWNWWFKGSCNAFRNDPTREASVGLGGNISKSLTDLSQNYARCDAARVSPVYESEGEDAGNGSLMRLAPVAICFSCDVAAAMNVARQSSLATHPGTIAAEACAFLAYLIATAIHDPRLPLVAAGAGAAAPPLPPSSPATAAGSLAGEGVALSAAQWLDESVDAYIDHLVSAVCGAPGDCSSSSSSSSSAAAEREARFQRTLSEPAAAHLRPLLLLLRSQLPSVSTERCWNWRSADGLDIKGTLARRGHSYNGYPVSPGYFGAFSMDGLAIAVSALVCFRPRRLVFLKEYSTLLVNASLNDIVYIYIYIYVHYCLLALLGTEHDFV